MAQDRKQWRAFVNAVMSQQVPYNEENFFTSIEPVRFSRRTELHGVGWFVGWLVGWIVICYSVPPSKCYSG